MSSDEITIRVENLSKCYQIYGAPQNRLKQSIYPRLHRLIGKPPKNYYQEFWALKNVSFEVAKGETVGIVGRNGSGKSTLLQLICGTLNPTSGSLITSGRIAALLELGSSFNREFTGRENVYMNATILGLSKQEINAKFEDIVAFADIGDFINRPIKTYSSGMMMRLAFAVAIHVEPQVLVIDEALAVGDEVFQRKCFSRIASIKEAGATILFVSHSSSTVVGLCDRALLLDQGELLTTGEPKKIIGQYEKLLYAPPHKRKTIREEIKAEITIAAQGRSQKTAAAKNTKSTSKIAAFNQPKNPETPEYFDPNLKPKSTISYESHGAFIHSPRILTRAGKSVNCLQQGKVYRFTYTVNFDGAATKVRFGMLIKTLSGVELGGAVSAPSFIDGIPHVEAGSRMQVEFRFNCLLNSGVYFLNAGVVGAKDTNEIFLHRLLDVFMFRVLPIKSSLSTGTVHFTCTSDIQLIQSNELTTVP